MPMAFRWWSMLQRNSLRRRTCGGSPARFGADLAVFSGGKDFRGPQASGLLVGTEAMIAAVAVNGSPHQRLARPMKVGKEEMIGLLAAVERYIDEDWQDRARRYEATVERVDRVFPRRARIECLARLPE